MHDDTRVRLGMVEHRRYSSAPFETVTHQFSRVIVLPPGRCFSHPVQPPLQLGILPTVLEFMWQLDKLFLFALRVDVALLHFDEREIHFVLALFSSLLAHPPTSANNAFLASNGGIAANKSSLDPLVLVLQPRATMSTSHEFTTVIVLLHSIHSFRRGRSLACFRRRSFPRTKLAHSQRPVHLLLSDLVGLAPDPSHLPLPQIVSASVLHSTSSSSTSTCANSTTSCISSESFFAYFRSNIFWYFTVILDKLASSSSIVFSLFPSVFIFFPSCKLRVFFVLALCPFLLFNQLFPHSSTELLVRVTTSLQLELDANADAT